MSDTNLERRTDMRERIATYIRHGYTSEQAEEAIVKNAATKAAESTKSLITESHILANEDAKRVVIFGCGTKQTEATEKRIREAVKAAIKPPGATYGFSDFQTSISDPSIVGETGKETTKKPSITSSLSLTEADVISLEYRPWSPMNHPHPEQGYLMLRCSGAARYSSTAVIDITYPRYGWVKKLFAVVFANAVSIDEHDKTRVGTDLFLSEVEQAA